VNAITTIKGMLIKAREGEEAGNIEEAISTYQKVIASDPVNEDAYERLMILYRKQKDYKKELGIIDKGLKAFEKLYKPKTTGRLKKVAEISLKMAKSVGLVDKKGEATYEPEPIAKWKKRRLIVEKKMSK
jgi:tetratricopeptide (TPR) repeat protein